MYIKYKELHLKLENSGIKTTLVDLYIFKCSKLLRPVFKISHEATSECYWFGLQHKSVFRTS